MSILRRPLTRWIALLVSVTYVVVTPVQAESMRDMTAGMMSPAVSHGSAPMSMAALAEGGLRIPMGNLPREACVVLQCQTQAGLTVAHTSTARRSLSSHRMVWRVVDTEAPRAHRLVAPIDQAPPPRPRFSNHELVRLLI